MDRGGLGACLLCTSPHLRLADSSRTLTWPHDPRTPRLQGALPPGPQSRPDRIPPETWFQGSAAKQREGEKGSTVVRPPPGPLPPSLARVPLGQTLCTAHSGPRETLPVLPGP